jgi:hypothetical protein
VLAAHLGQRVQPNRHLGPAVEQEGALRLEFVRLDGQGQVGEALEQRGQRDRRLQPAQRRPDAEVHAVPERQVLLVRPGDVEQGRALAVQLPVPAGGGEPDQHRVTLRDGHSGDLDLLGGEPERQLGDRRLHPEGLLDDLLPGQLAALDQLELIGVGEHGEGGVGDEVGRGLRTRPQHQVHGAGHLRVVEP